MRKAWKAAALAALVFLSSTAVPAAHAEDGEESAPLTGETIYVYNWGEYMADGRDGSLDINTEFTRRTGIQVEYSTFDTNESLYAKLVSGGAS